MKKHLICSVVAVLLTGCNDGNNGNTNAGVSPGVTPAAAVGAIQNINPENKTVNVNGVWYPVSKIAYASVPLEFSDLQTNMNVKVRNSSLQRQAGVDLSLEPTVSGEIQNINHVTGTFTVNGMALTFVGISDQIQNGQWVAVSSRPDQSGGNRVTSVVQIQNPALYALAEIEGKITDVDENASTFTINGVTVSHDASTHLEGLTSPKVGYWVEVDGRYSSDGFQASKIENESYDFDFDDLIGEVELQGTVTWVAKNKTAFELNHRGNIQLTSTTSFDGGNKGMLKPGRQVEVSLYNSNGKQYAREVEFEDDLDDAWEGFEFECNGIVLNSTAASFNMRCNGQERDISIDSSTEFENVDPSQMDGLRLDVEGVIMNNRYIAREIEADD